MKKLFVMMLAASLSAPLLARVGNTPLHRAVRQGRWRQTLRLLERGANPNAQNDNGNTPMMVAARMPITGSRITAVDILLEKGADLTVRNQRGLTAIGIAKRRRRGWLPFLRWHAHYFRKEGKLAKDAIVD